MANTAAELVNDNLSPPQLSLTRQAQHAALRQRAKRHAMLAALSGAAPAFPAATQLASRWVAVHMLSNHITEPLSELLTAAGFSSDRRSSVPGKPHPCACCLALSTRMPSFVMDPAVFR